VEEVNKLITSHLSNTSGEPYILNFYQLGGY